MSYCLGRFKETLAEPIVSDDRSSGALAASSSRENVQHETPVFWVQFKPFTSKTVCIEVLLNPLQLLNYM